MKSELYLDKRVCALACGGSIDTHQIDFDYYDTVVGINRLYKTKYLPHLHVLYDAAHYVFDPVNKNKVDAINASNLKLWIITPGIITYNDMDKTPLQQCRIPHFISQDRFYAPPVRITLGIYVLKDILKERPKSLDIFGFDFYTQGYADQLPQMDPTEKIDDLYNLERQKGFLEEMLRENSCMRRA
jgi:hypothetical protein